MREPGVGRVLVASLHQAIAEVLPMRVDFYDNFLPAEGLREGTIGVAAFMAVVSFLRQEGGAYDSITRRAGEYAAEWTVQSVGAYQRAVMRTAPGWLRARLVLRLARRFVRTTCEQSRATARLRQGTVRIELRHSLFCVVRELHPQPLCRFYAAAVARLLVLFDVAAEVDVEACRATSAAGSPCIIRVSLGPHAGALAAETSA